MQAGDGARLTPAASAPADVTEAEVSAACRQFGEACADSMGYRTPIRKALEAFAARRPPAPTAAPVASIVEPLVSCPGCGSVDRVEGNNGGGWDCGRCRRWFGFTRPTAAPIALDKRALGLRFGQLLDDAVRRNGKADRDDALETIARDAVEWAFAAVERLGDPVYVGPTVAEARKALRVPVGEPDWMTAMKDVEPEGVDPAVRYHRALRVKHAEEAKAQIDKLTADLATAKAELVSVGQALGLYDASGVAYSGGIPLAEAARLQGKCLEGARADLAAATKRLESDVRMVDLERRVATLESKR